MWSVQSLFKFIHTKIGIPICFDAHHWLFCHDNDDMQVDFNLAKTTWARPMQVHYSESKSADKLIPAHSDYYKSPLPSFISSCDDIYVHLEAKQKELAVLKYKKDFLKELYE